MILRINNDKFPEQHYRVDLCNDKVLCYLRGMDWIYLEKLQLEVVKVRMQGTI